MKVVCAWCEKVLRGHGGVVSHGICPECAHAFETSTPAPSPVGSRPRMLEPVDEARA